MTLCALNGHANSQLIKVCVAKSFRNTVNNYVHQLQVIRKATEMLHWARCA